MPEVPESLGACRRLLHEEVELPELSKSLGVCSQRVSSRASTEYKHLESHDVGYPLTETECEEMITGAQQW